MSEPRFLTTPQDRRIAYRRIEGAEPGVIFLGGFASDMQGTKALHLDRYARGCARAFLRFDYSGHGRSSGDFRDGCIGDWAADAQAAIAGLTSGPQILVGSSMGGWIALICALAMPERVAGLVTVAAAPDFTEDSMWAGLDADQRQTLLSAGELVLRSDYSDDGYVITRRLIEEGRDHLVLRRPLPLPFPVRMLQGTADTDVEVAVALRLLDHADCADIRLTLVKGADHRFSRPDLLDMIGNAIGEVVQGCETGPDAVLRSGGE